MFFGGVTRVPWCQDLFVPKPKFDLLHGTPVIPPKIIERLSYQMLFFKCRQLFIENAKIWRLFSLRNKNKNKSRNLALKSGNAGGDNKNTNNNKSALRKRLIFSKQNQQPRISFNFLQLSILIKSANTKLFMCIVHQLLKYLGDARNFPHRTLIRYRTLIRFL